jgi:putative transposase
MKPGAGHFRIEYANGQSYEPDFVVETRSQKLIVEIKAANEIRDVLLEFYNFPAEHWKYLRTTNPIESMFATVRHRMIRSKGCLSNKTALAMVFKLVEGAQKT